MVEKLTQPELLGAEVRTTHDLTIEKLRSLKKTYDELTPEEKEFCKEEEKKCLASPLYFYNNYWRKEGQPEMTQLDWDAHTAMIELADRAERSRERFGGISELLRIDLLPEFLKKKP